MGVLSNIDPTAVTVWVATIVLFALIALLRAVFKLNFSVLTILALMLGIALSLAFNGNVDSLNLLGNIYINLITALVAPLIFVSIISSITYVGSLHRLRSIGLRSVGWLLLTNLIAIVLTLSVAIPLHIGSGVTLVNDKSTAGFLTSSRRTSSATCPVTAWCRLSSLHRYWQLRLCRSASRRAWMLSRGSSNRPRT